MNRWLSFRITQQFLLFFLFTSILPIASISFLFFQSIDNKFSERINRMLAIGALMTEEVYRDDLEKLSVSTNQAAYFSMNREFQNFLRGRDAPTLKRGMESYIRMRKLDVLVIYDAKGNVIARAGNIQDASPRSYYKLLAQAMSGRSVNSVEHYRSYGGDYSLEYVSAVPIFSKDGNPRVLGVLLAGQSLNKNLLVKRLSDTLPELEFRIYVKSGPGLEHRQLYSSIDQRRAELPREVLTSIEQYEPKRILASDIQGNVFRERIGGDSYKSKVLVLRNFIREPVGFFVISSSESDLSDLKLKNFSYVAICLLFGVLVVGLMGVWFKRTFVDPMKDLAGAAEKVRQGKLDCSLDHFTGGHEIDTTIDSFNKMLAQLREDERLRSTFVSTLTHDLRTPLIAQKRVLEMFEEYAEEFPEEFDQLNRGLLKNNDHLLDMVNKLLEAYQYEAGKIVLIKSYFSLYSLVRECFEEATPLAAPKNIRLNNLVPQTLPMIYADKDQLKRVFQNLIGNAVSNIQENRQVEVTAGLKEGRLTFQVSDNGPGINPDILPHLFTRYFTGDRLRQKIGSGLGLYICRMIIEQHGGKIWAESEIGKGTTILFEIPQGGQERED